MKSHPPEERPPKLIDFGGLKGGSSFSRFCFGIPPTKKPTLGGVTQDQIGDRRFSSARYTSRPSVGGSRLEAVFRFLRVESRLFLGIHSKGRVGSAGRRRSVAEGWGLETREVQYGSRDTISERWGERTHSKTQAQPRLHPSALAVAGLLLSTLGSRVGNTSWKIASYFRKFKCQFFLSVWYPTQSLSVWETQRAYNIL